MGQDHQSSKIFDWLQSWLELLSGCCVIILRQTICTFLWHPLASVDNFASLRLSSNLERNLNLLLAKTSTDSDFEITLACLPVVLYNSSIKKKTTNVDTTKHSGQDLQCTTNGHIAMCLAWISLPSASLEIINLAANLGHKFSTAEHNRSFIVEINNCHMRWIANTHKLGTLMYKDRRTR